MFFSKNTVNTSISHKLLFYILIFSSVTTLFTTAITLYTDYTLELNLIAKQIEDIEKSSLGSISQSLWYMDSEYVQSQLDGLLRLPDVAYLKIISNIKQNNIEIGSQLQEHMRSYEFPLRYAADGREYDLGTLQIMVNLNNMYQRIFSKILVILGTQTAKTFIVSIFIFFIVQQVITRHLIKISKFLRQKDLSNLDQQVQLDQPAQEQNELTNMADTINLMANELNQSFLLREEKALLEKQLLEDSKMKTLGTLAGGIAHDLNNILAVIIGSAELAADTANTSTKEMLNEIIRSGTHGADIIRQVLTYCQHEQVQKITLHPSQAAREALKLVRAALPSTVDITEQINPDCGNILAVKTDISQILINLCTNAAHALDNQIGEISIELDQIFFNAQDLSNDPEVTPGHFALLTVTDTGRGMTSETMQRIFEPYFTTQEFGKGSGMGLSVVHGIVKRNKGFIRVKSEVGQGTTFCVALPIIGRQENDTLLHESRP